MFKTNKDELTIKDIKSFIDLHAEDKMKYEKLQDYYLGKHDILMTLKDKDVPNNMLVHSYPKYITDMLTGYFIGQPVKYSAVDKDSEKDDALLKTLDEIFKYNDEQEENLELAKIASIKGVSYEILWLDDDKKIRFKKLPPDEVFLIHDNTLEEKIRFAVRYYMSFIDGKEVENIELYDKQKISYFDNSKGQLLLTHEELHSFQDVPIIMYENNAEELGDFEQVISLIDAYNKAQSNTLNDMEQFTDAYLVLTNLSGTQDEDIKELREKRVFLMEADGGASWLIKDVNDAWVENYKKRLKADIHKFSYTPDMTDENFGSNLSGVSLRYKLLGMEQIRATKERKFKKGLQRRIELICNVLQISSNLNNYTSIGMQFNNTLPQNILEIAQIIQALSPYLPIETLIEQLPFVENAKEEMEKKKMEDDSSEDYESLLSMLPSGAAEEESHEE